jgi:hypothetical protein
MRLSTRITVIAVFATLVLTSAVFAAKAPHNPLSSSAPLVATWVFDGSRSVPIQLECAGTRETENGPVVVVRNTSGLDAFLVFKDGTSRLLAPDQELELVGEAAATSTNKCVCKCTCSGADGSQSITFDCASSTGPDQCPTSNGSNCMYFDSNNKLHTGTLSGCTRWYIPIVSVDPTQPTEPTQQ